MNSIEGFWSLMKRQIIGQQQWVSVEHPQSYLNERVYMFNNRKEEDVFEMVIAALAIAAPLPFAVLTAGVEPSLDIRWLMSFIVAGDSDQSRQNGVEILAVDCGASERALASPPDL